jgi:hypothetical protein
MKGKSMNNKPDVTNVVNLANSLARLRGFIARMDDLTYPDDAPLADALGTFQYELAWTADMLTTILARYQAARDAADRHAGAQVDRFPVPAPTKARLPGDELY